jgi:hypothetical protein
VPRHLTHILITAAAFGVVLVHLLWPKLNLDAVSVTFLVIAVLPWLGTVFKKLELPGGLKIEYADLRKAEKAAEEAGLLTASSATEVAPEPAALAMAREDPNLALVSVRIEIERRLRDIALASGIEAERMGIGQLLRALEQRQAIGAGEASALRDMVGTLNDAAHGAQVDREAANWALERGPLLLAALDRIAEGRRVDERHS